MNALPQIKESFSAHITTTLSKDFSRINDNPAVVHKAEVANQVCALRSNSPPS